MIEKRAEYFSSDFDYPIFSLLEKGNEKELTKTASYDGPVSEYLGSLKREKGYLYALVNALTAGEYYGPNRNGDFFPEEALKKHHKTFEEFGHVYKHHINKDPRKSMGKVLFSHYNPKMRRVEVVVRLKKSHPDVQNLQEGISKGMLPKVSMGCRVPYDVCSITGKKARTRDEYSEYLLHQMGKILPDGRRVCAINTRPKFFDVSIVVIPADPVAAFMATFDEEGGYLKQAEQFIVSEEPKGLTKVATLIDEKTSQITKEVSGDFENIQEDPSDLIKNTTPRFTQDEIEKLSAYPLNEVLSTFAALRIFPHREDFQKIALYSIGEKDLANELEKKGTYFSNPKTAVELSDLGISHMKEKIANELIGSISKYSLTKPFIINRIVEKSASLNDIVAPILPNKKEVERSFIKKLIMDGEPEPATSGVKNPLAAFTTLGTLYAGFALLYGKTANSSEFVKMVSKHP